MSGVCTQIQEACARAVPEEVIGGMKKNMAKRPGTMAMTDFFKTSNPEKKLCKSLSSIANAEMHSLMARLLAEAPRKGQKVEAILLDDEDSAGAGEPLSKSIF